MHIPLFGALFVITGATGLLVEQAFEKLLTTVVGSSTTAGSLVLSTYFVGLAIGGLAYGRLTSFLPRPARIYGLVEGLVGAYALAVALLAQPLLSGSAALIHLGGGSEALTFLLRLLVACLWILPPTICMGASFPAIVAVLRGRFVERGSSILAVFYSLNLLGAMLSSVVGPYLLFAELGLIGTLFAVVGLQTCVVLGIVALERSASKVTEMASPQSPQSRRLAPRIRHFVASPGVPPLLATAFVSGVVVFGAEVVWLHLMGVTLGMSVYTFGNMLSIVLASLFLGGALVSFIAGKSPTLPPIVMPIALLVAGAMMGVTSQMWDEIPIRILEHADAVDGFFAGELVRVRLATEVTLPAAVALGVVYPLLLRLPAFSRSEPDVAAGVLGAVNAVGSMVGALGVTALLIPSIGSDGTLLLLACTPVALAVVWSFVLARSAAAAAEPTRRSPLAYAAFGLAFVASTALATRPMEWSPIRLTAGTNVYFSTSFAKPTSEIVYWHEDTEGGITTVVTEPEKPGLATLLTNGKFQGNNSGETVDQTAFALIPCAVTKNRDRALVIGLGTGHSAAVARAAGFAALDVVDISRGIEGAARTVFSELNRHVLDDPRVRFVHEDGRNHLLRTPERYDVVSMELSSVWFAGVGNLYSREFYDLVKTRLAPQGVMQQWVQLHHISPDEVISAIATLRDVFPYVTLWSLHNQGVLVASMEPHDVQPDVIASMHANPQLTRDLARLERLPNGGIDHLAAYRILDAEATTRLLEHARATGIPLNTDARRFLEYWTPRHNLERVNHGELVMEKLMALTTPPPPLP